MFVEVAQNEQWKTYFYRNSQILMSNLSLTQSLTNIFCLNMKIVIYNQDYSRFRPAMDMNKVIEQTDLNS